MDELARQFGGVLWAHGHEHVEMEFRLGRLGARGFEAGVTKEVFCKIQDAFDAGKQWDSVATSTSTELIKDDARYCVETGRTTFKRRLVAQDLGDLGVAGPFSVRAAVSLEAAPAGGRQPPRPQDPQHRRVKKRTSYVTKCWRFDLTKVVSTRNLDCDTETYEVEVELADAAVLFDMCIGGVLHWGAHLAKDALSIAAAAVATMP